MQKGLPAGSRKRIHTVPSSTFIRFSPPGSTPKIMRTQRPEAIRVFHCPYIADPRNKVFQNGCRQRHLRVLSRRPRQRHPHPLRRDRSARSGSRHCHQGRHRARIRRQNRHRRGRTPVPAQLVLRGPGGQRCAQQPQRLRGLRPG